MATVEPSADDLLWSRRILESCALPALVARAEQLQNSDDIIPVLRRELDGFAWDLVSRLLGLAPANDTHDKIPLDIGAGAR